MLICNVLVQMEYELPTVLPVLLRSLLRKSSQVL